jgi:hypothetical protein
LDFFSTVSAGNQEIESLGGLRMALRTSDHLFHSPCARRAAIALSLAVVFTVFASAQNTNGRIIGTVTDTQGAAIAGAKISVTNTGTNVLSDTVTNNEGYYQVLQLPVGSYTVTVEHAGHSPEAGVGHGNGASRSGGSAS